jgi:hypothetical protein
MQKSDILQAHKHCSNHRAEVLSSALCGCFYCLQIFLPTEILDWIDNLNHLEGTTALCPKCGIDSVLGDKSGYPITGEFLQQMEQYWFQT